MGDYFDLDPQDDPTTPGTVAPQAPKARKPNQLLKTIQGGMSGMGQQPNQGDQGGGGAFNPASSYTNIGSTIGTLMRPSMATGGYVQEPTDALIGEGGEGEYVVPASKVKGFAAQVAVGSPIDPKFLPPDDGPQYSPITPSMRGGQPPPPPLGSPSAPPPLSRPQQPPVNAGPSGPPPALTTPGQPPPQPQLPQLPVQQKAGLGRRLAAAAIGGLGGYVNAAGKSHIDPATIEGAEQGILHPGYAQQMQQYQLQTKRAQDQSKLNSEGATAEHARAQGRLADQTAATMAEEGKRKPKDNYVSVGGGLFNADTGAWVKQPVDKTQLTPISEDQAQMYGIKPLADGTYAIPNTAVGSLITAQKESKPTASVHMLPDGTVIAYTPGSDAAKVVFKGDPKVETDLTDLQIGGVPHKAIVNKQTGVLIKDLGPSGIKPPVVNVNANDRKDKEAGLKAYTPALESAERFNVMTKNYEDAVNNHDQQAMLSLLANHLGMTMGLQKGARLTKDIIQEAQHSAPWLQSMQAKFSKDGYLSGVNLTPEQMRQMVDLGRHRFAEDAVKGNSQAQYMGVNDGGPARVPGKSTMNHYLALTNGNAAEAKKLAAADGWSVQ